MGMRRPNGAGQVVKLAGKRRRPYAVRVTNGWNPETGKRAVKYLEYFEKYTDAENYLATLRMNPLADVDKTDVTLAQVHDDWKAVKYKTISEGTQSNYDFAWGTLSALENLKIRNIRTAHLQKIIDNAKTKERKNNPSRSLSRSMLSKIKVLATMLWDYAVQNDIVDKNYAEFITLPKSVSNEKQSFNDLEILAIEKAAAAGVEWADAILMMIYTGFRLDEFLSLTPFSYDRARQTLTGGMKTDAGRNRVVPVHSKIRPYVEAWLKKGGETIICNAQGKKVQKDHFRARYYYRALEAAGVRRLTPHATRHTFASILFAAGADPVQVQKLMGHADYSVTANTYTHINLESLKMAINAL